ncbi:MAG: phosphonate metabolism protein/1,5-bisphosphokinase (PRPP-forming) PhnN [Devosia sp.]
MTGRLVLVVGPSGAGKDSVINAARKALADVEHFHFVRRVVTRESNAEIEDHETLSPAAFEAAHERGAFALNWQAHGLSYGLPIAIEQKLADGRIVIANASRRIVGEALRRYPKALVVMIDAPLEIRAARLAKRGREEPRQIARRLKREADLPASIPAVHIDNSGPLVEAVARFLEILRATG